jgi:hypothetical protein
MLDTEEASLDATLKAELTIVDSEVAQTLP